MDDPRARGRPPGPVPEHGTWSRYTHHGCRCDACRTNHALRIRTWRHTGTTTTREAPPA